MEMPPLQIASEYRTAANKSKQIKVLAELNLVTQRRIAEILQEQGEELPGHWKEKLEKGLKTQPRAYRPGSAPSSWRTGARARARGSSTRWRPTSASRSSTWRRIRAADRRPGERHSDSGPASAGKET